jgi:hypothetical protein
MNKHWVVLLGGFVTILAAADTASAIPAFQRRYGVECHFCHDGYPKLNQNGQRFKERGFRMAQEDPFDVGEWAKTVPLSVRAMGNHTFIEDVDGVTFAFFKGITAGNLGSRVSYWVDDGLFWQDLPDDAPEDSDSFTHTKPDNAWGRIELVQNGKFYLKGGRFELDLPFTQARTPQLFGYDIYTTNTGEEYDAIGLYQEGAEVGGTLPGDARWSAAVVKGRNAPGASDINEEAGNFDANLYLRASKRFTRNRIGAFAYFGRNKLPVDSANVIENDLLRLGADADVRAGKLNVYGVFMYGRNSDAFGIGVEQSFTGGFVQGDFQVHDAVQLTLRVNAVNAPASSAPSSKETLTSVFPGVRVYVRERLRLAFEWGFQSDERPDIGAVQAELAF